jgi:hypothetical protein
MVHDWIKDHHSIITRVTVSLLLVLHITLYTVDNVGYEKIYKKTACADETKWALTAADEFRIMYSYPKIKIADGDTYVKKASEKFRTFTSTDKGIQGFLFKGADNHWDEMCDGYAKFNGLTYNLMIMSLLVLGVAIAHVGSRGRMITSAVLFFFAVITYAMRLGFTHHMMNADSCQGHYFDKMINQDTDGNSYGCEDSTHELQAESGVLITSIVLSLTLGILQITTEYL